MTNEQSVTELALRWLELRQQGQPVSASELCAGCPELLADVQKQIQALASMEAFLGLGASTDPPRGTVVGTGPWTPAQRPEETLASAPARAAVPLIPGYEIVAVLGRGGMGIVYKARHLGLKREVALKMILAGAHAGPQELARFRSEAEAVARLQHPNIVQVHDIGEHDGRPFFSLEFVEGGSLDKKLAATPQPPGEAARLVQTLAQAMHYAHQRGIVHRDLKPANVLLQKHFTAEDAESAERKTETKNGSTERGRQPVSVSPSSALSASSAVNLIPKITDFGLAKRLDVEMGQTQSGLVLGTPSYMSPEQAGGKTKEIGPATDVYALGAILYEMVAGRPPFKAASVWDTINQVLSEEPLPPSRLQSKVPPDLETICLKCLNKEPGRRYASAEALADDLHRFLTHVPIQARPASLWERGAKWVRRNPIQAGLDLAVFLAVLAALAAFAFYGLYQRQQAGILRERLERLEQARAKIGGHQLKAKGHEDDEQWSEAEKELAAALATLLAHQDLRDDYLEQELEKRLAVARQHLAEQQHLAGALKRKSAVERSYNDSLFHETAFTGQEQASNLAQARAHAIEGLQIYGLGGEQDPEDGVTSLLERDRSYHPPAEQGRLAAQCYELLLIWADTEAASPPGKPETPEQVRQRGVKALNLLARAGRLGLAYQLESQVYHLRKARYEAQAQGKQFDPARAEKLAAGQPTGRLDWFLRGLEQYKQDQFAESIAACDRVLQQENKDFWAHYVKALGRLKQGRWVDAKAELTVCLNLRPDFVWPLLVRGLAASELGSNDKKQGRVKDKDNTEFHAAEADFSKALQSDKDKLVQFVGLANRGVLEIRRENYAAAVRDLEEAVKVNPEGVQAYVNLATALQGMGRKEWDRALAALDRAIQLAPKQPRLHETRARLHLQRGDRALARADLEKAVACEPADSKSPELASNLVELGRLLHGQKQDKEALACCDRALRVQPNYVLAQRFRAEALLALDRPAEAGQALDRYLARTALPPLEVCQARGLIHAKLGQLPAAIEMYSAVLRRAPGDAETRHLRGWSYLQIDAPRLALDDFEECLRQEPEDVEALVGRGKARIRLRQPAEALADAAAAEKHGPLTDRLLYHLTGIYALAAAQAEVEAQAGRDRLAGQRLALYQDKALTLLRRTLEELPAERRREFWRERVESDPALAAIRRGAAYFRLAQQYGRVGL